MSNPIVVQAIPLAQIRPMPNQPRRVITQEAIDLMASSLTAIGQEDPVKVRPLTPEEKATSAGVEYELIGGHIRFAGAQKAGLATLNCQIWDVTPQVARRKARIDNQKTDMYWLDWVLEIEDRSKEADDPTQEAIAAEFGVSQDQVSRALRVAAGLTQASRDLLYASCVKLGPQKAITQNPIQALVTLGDPLEVEKALPTVLDRKLTQPQVQALVASLKAGNPAHTHVTAPKASASRPQAEKQALRVPISPKPEMGTTPALHADSPIAGAKAPQESAQPSHAAHLVGEQQAMGSAETALYEAVAGVSVIAKIRSKIKKGERPNLFEVCLLAGYNLWHGLVWLVKNGFRLTKLTVKWTFKAIKFVWHLVMGLLKFFRVYQFAQAVAIIGLLIGLFIGGSYVHEHGTRGLVHLVYTKIVPASTPAPTPVIPTPQPTPQQPVSVVDVNPTVVNTPVPTPEASQPVKKAVLTKTEPTLEPTAVPTTVAQAPTPNAKGNMNGPLHADSHLESAHSNNGPQPEVSAQTQSNPAARPVNSQQTPTPKPQGDLLTLGADMATKGARLIKTFGF